MSDDEATITELAKGIFLYENVFDAEDFVQMIEKEAAKDWPYLSWVPSSIGNGTVSEYRTSYQLELGILLGTDVIDGHRLYKVSQLWKKMFNAIDRYVYDYRDKHSLTLSSDEGYRVLKYSNGSEYLEHIDWHPDNDRQISLVGWLNDDFEGGELYFKHFDLTVKPKAGSFVIFPSNFLYLHSALPVGDVNKHEIKYSFVTWFR